MARGWARSNEEEVPHPFVLVRGRGVGRNFTGDEPWRRSARVLVVERARGLARPKRGHGRVLLSESN